MRVCGLAQRIWYVRLRRVFWVHVRLIRDPTMERTSKQALDLSFSALWASQQVDIHDPTVLRAQRLL